MAGNARPAGVDPLNAFPEVRSLHVVTVRIRSDLPKTLTPARPATRLHGRLYLLPSQHGDGSHCKFSLSTLNAHLTFGKARLRLSIARSIFSQYLENMSKGESNFLKSCLLMGAAISSQV